MNEGKRYEEVALVASVMICLFNDVIEVFLSVSRLGFAVSLMLNAQSTIMHMCEKRL